MKKTLGLLGLIAIIFMTLSFATAAADGDGDPVTNAGASLGIAGGSEAGVSAVFTDYVDFPTF